MPTLTPASLVLAAGLAATIGLGVALLSEDAPVAVQPAPDAMAPLRSVAPVAVAPAVAAAPAPPRFDVLRVAPDGSAVAAGRAAPGAKVTIAVESGTLAEVEADAGGDFVAVFKAEPSAAPQALTLTAETEKAGAVTSEEVVVLVPAAQPPAPEAAAEAPAPQPAAARAAPAEAKAQVAATAVLREDGAEVTKAEGAPSPGLALATISYGEAGALRLSGLGDAGGQVRAYVDDRFSGDAAVDAAGRWSLDLGDVPTGLRRLRLDAVRLDGTVAHRIETPFQRDTPPVPAAGGPASVTVQPGGNLWTLARIHYGSGVRYTQIHAANRALIRDPDLIYPGQIFVLPEDAAAAD